MTTTEMTVRDRVEHLVSLVEDRDAFFDAIIALDVIEAKAVIAYTITRLSLSHTPDDLFVNADLMTVCSQCEAS